MSRAEQGRYRGELAKWEKACRTLGRSCDDAARRALHKAAGAPHSSKDFTWRDLKNVVKAMQAISDMGNLNAQLADPTEDLRNRAWDAIQVIVTKPWGNRDLYESRRAYLDGMCRRICGTSWEQLTHDQIAKVMGAAEKAARREEAKTRATASAATQAADANPF